MDNKYKIKKNKRSLFTEHYLVLGTFVIDMYNLQIEKLKLGKEMYLRF